MPSYCPACGSSRQAKALSCASCGLGSTARNAVFASTATVDECPMTRDCPGYDRDRMVCLIRPGDCEFSPAGGGLS